MPNEEIWMKICRDHGQGSLKATIQVFNIEKPNSKFHTSFFAMAQVPDNVHKLQTLLDRIKVQIQNMQKDKWNEEAIRIFLCGVSFSCRHTWYPWILPYEALQVKKKNKYIFQEITKISLLREQKKIRKRIWRLSLCKGTQNHLKQNV